MQSQQHGGFPSGFAAYSGNETFDVIPMELGQKSFFILDEVWQWNIMQWTRSRSQKNSISA